MAYTYERRPLFGGEWFFVDRLQVLSFFFRRFIFSTKLFLIITRHRLSVVPSCRELDQAHHGIRVS
jgi:hypothetical protein